MKLLEITFMDIFAYDGNPQVDVDDENSKHFLSASEHVTRVNRAQNTEISIHNYDEFYFTHCYSWSYGNFSSFLLSHCILNVSSFVRSFVEPSRRAAWFEGITNELRSCFEPLHCLNVCNKTNCWADF